MSNWSLKTTSNVCETSPLLRDISATASIILFASFSDIPRSFNSSTYCWRNLVLIDAPPSNIPPGAPAMPPINALYATSVNISIAVFPRTSRIIKSSANCWLPSSLASTTNPRIALRTKLLPAAFHIKPIPARSNIPSVMAYPIARLYASSSDKPASSPSCNILAPLSAPIIAAVAVAPIGPPSADMPTMAITLPTAPPMSPTNVFRFSPNHLVKRFSFLSNHFKYSSRSFVKSVILFSNTDFNFCIFSGSLSMPNFCNTLSDSAFSMCATSSPFSPAVIMAIVAPGASITVRVNPRPNSREKLYIALLLASIFSPPK